MSVWLSADEAMESLFQSSSVSLPVTSFWLSTKLSLDKSRIASCSRDISREKNATVLLVLFATDSATFSAIDVLPMPGRAAMRSGPIYSDR